MVIDNNSLDVVVVAGCWLLWTFRSVFISINGEGPIENFVSPNAIGTVIWQRASFL